MKPESSYVLLARFLGAYRSDQTKEEKADAREKARYLADELDRDGLKVVRK